VHQSRPVQQSMSGRISTKVTFPKHAEYVTDTGSIIINNYSTRARWISNGR